MSLKDYENEENEFLNVNDIDKSINGVFALQDKNRKEIEEKFQSMKKDKMWRLSSGKFVEEELFNLGKKLNFENAIHSFILDIDDDLIINHFTNEELKELESVNIPDIPDIPEEIITCLEKFLNKTNSDEIRSTLKEIGFETRNHDIDYICLAIHACVREIESGKLKIENLEAWYDCHLWEVIIDQAFGNVKTLNIVRGESTSISTAVRKNFDRQLGSRRKMGYRTDWILRSIGKGEKNEFAAGEAGKFWSDKKGTKYIKENSLKLPKNLKDMLTNLMEKVNFDENKCRKLQTIGIIHSGLVMAVMYMENPKGYISRIRRGELFEIPDEEENFPSLLNIIAAVLNFKSAVLETLKVIKPETPTTKSLKDAGIRKNVARQDKHWFPMCISTPKR
nr:11414_t:CDS:2 [Entrophospora candida]